MTEHHFILVPQRIVNAGTGNDFALIFLPDIPDVNEGVVAGIVPVELNSDEDVPTGCDVLEVFGWGLTGTDQINAPLVPNTGKMVSIPIKVCEAIYGGLTTNGIFW